MKFLAFFLINCIHCHLIAPAAFGTHEESLPFNDTSEVPTHHNDTISIATEMHEVFTILNGTNEIYSHSNGTHDLSSHSHKPERVFVPHPLNDTLGHNITVEFWDRYRQTSFIMMQVLSFHQLFYSSDGALTPAAASILLQNINYAKFEHTNYTPVEVKECVYESYHLLPPSIQKKIGKFLKSVRDKYLYHLKEPRIAAKAKKVLKAFRTGEIFSYDNNWFTLSVKNMTANEQWEATVFDPSRLVYLEYPSIAETNDKMVIDPLPYIKKFEKFSSTIEPDAKFERVEDSVTVMNGTETTGQHHDYTGPHSNLSSHALSTTPTISTHPTSEQNQTHYQEHSTQATPYFWGSTSYPSGFTQENRITQTVQTISSDHTVRNDQTSQTEKVNEFTGSVQTSPASLHQTSDTSKTEVSEQATTRGVANSPVHVDIFSFSFLQHQAGNSIDQNKDDTQSTPSDNFRLVSDRTTADVANVTERTVDSTFPTMTTSYILASSTTHTEITSHP